MPTAQITCRFKDSPYLAENNYAAVKKAQRLDVKKRYPGAKVATQQVITDGIPDWVRLGDLRSKGEVAIRTEFIVSEEQAAEMKRLSK